MSNSDDRISAIGKALADEPDPARGKTLVSRDELVNFMTEISTVILWLIKAQTKMRDGEAEDASTCIDEAVDSFTTMFQLVVEYSRGA